MGYIGAGISRFNTADELTVTGDATIDTTTLVVDSTNNRVGIGTASPTTALDVTGTAVVDALTCSGTANIEGTSNFGTSSGDTRFNFDGPNQYRAVFKSSGTIGGQIGAAGADDLRFSNAAGATVASIKDGNLLIGKTASGIGTEGIELRANDDVMITQSGDTCLYLNRLSSDGGIIDLRKDGTTVGTIGVVNNNNPFIANDADNSGLQFASTSILPHYDDLQRDNAVDLGSSTARFKDGYFNGTLYAGRFAGKSDTDTFIDFQGSNVMQFFTANSERLRIMSDGRIGKGRTSAIQGEDISHEYNSNNGAGLLMHSTDTSGNTHSQVIFRRNGSNVGSIQTSGSATSYNTSSDRRLKSNIEDAASASDKIDAIQVRQFDWNADDSHQDYGLIAQELQPIEPLAVSGDADSDEMMAVDYSKLVPMLIKEIQELRSRVAALEE